MAACSTALHPATLQRIHVMKEQLRADLNSLCLEPSFAEMLRHFSAQRLIDRLDMFQTRVQVLLSTFSRWAAAVAVAAATTAPATDAMCCHAAVACCSFPTATVLLVARAAVLVLR